MSKELFVRAEEVAGVLGISKPYAYKLVREMNEELKQKGFLTIPGRVSRRYFEEKFYGLRERTETELPYDSIYYLESDLRKINVYGDVAHQPLCSYYGKLNELPQALFENGFLRVGRSAVVNMKYIRQISSYMVTLRNGVKLGVSRNGYAEIRSTYLEWKGQFGDD